MNEPRLGTFAVALVAGIVMLKTVSAQENNPRLHSIEQRIQQVYESVSPAIVRIAIDGEWERSYGSGVIVTANGHVVTRTDKTPIIRDIRPEDSLALYLSDGRRVPGTVLGWSEEWQIGLAKITAKGPWPHVTLGNGADVKAGELCVALGYDHLVGNQYDGRPTLRLGSVTKSAAPIWFTSSCVVRDFGSVFNLDGRFVGVTTRQPFGKDPVHTRTALITTHWDQLVAGENLDRLRLLPFDETAGEPAGTTRSPTDKQPTPAARKTAKAATIRFHAGDDDKGVSGVIVTADGYVATCAHHWRLPGEKVTVYLPDGREAAGQVLGTNWISDICLLKITEKGPWPHAELGNSTAMRPNDPCLVMGYPVRRRAKEPLIRRTQIVEPQDYLWSSLLLTSSNYELYGGDSGGGVFDLDGRVIAVNQGKNREAVGRHRRVELFRKQWDFLAAGKPVDVSSSDPVGEISEAFSRFVDNDLRQLVVEVLGDNKRRVLGTIVGSDGRIITKASELFGTLSCRLANGQTYPATVEKVSRQHDLAVLRIEASDLPSAKWSQSKKVSVGTLIAALRPRKPPLAGVVSQNARAVPPQHVGIHGLRDTDSGLEIDDDSLARQFGLPLRKGDVILRAEGHETPTLDAFLRLIAPEDGVPIAYAGDPIRVDVRRGSETLQLRFPLPPRTYYRDPNVSLRCSAFASVFDTDVPLTPDLCGAPLIDMAGGVIGIAIACRAPGQTHIVPAAIARSFIDD